MNTLTKSKKEKALIPKIGKEKYVILLEDLEFAMSRDQLKQVTHLHNEGMAVEDIAQEVERDKWEVLIALIHQAKTNKVPLRPFAYRRNADVAR